MPRRPAPPAIPDTIHHLAALRGGVVMVRDLLSAGLTHSGIRSLVRAGLLFPVLRSTYSLRPDPGPRERMVAAALVCHPEAVVSHDAAATLLGWRKPWRTDVAHLWLPARATRGQERPGVRLHFGVVLPDEVVHVDGVRVTAPDRLARDVLTWHDRDSAVALLDQGLRCGSLAQAQLDGVASRLPPRLQAWAALTDRRAESPLETRVRLLLRDHGLLPDLQVEVPRPAREPLRVDLGWDRWKVGVECDGREWHEGEEPLTHDHTRAAELSRRGWDIIRVTWRHLVRNPRWIVEEVRAHLALRQNRVA